MRMDAVLKDSAARNEAFPSIAVIREDVFVVVVLVGTGKMDNCVRFLQCIDFIKADGRDWVSYDGVGVSGRTSGLCAGMRSTAFSRYRSVTDPTQQLGIETRYMLYKSWYILIHVFSGARTFFLTKKIYALYKVNINANTIDKYVFEPIYNTAEGSCKRRQLYYLSSI
jgi:hypothetical protein